jgi:hypothetical protein
MKIIHKSIVQIYCIFLIEIFYLNICSSQDNRIIDFNLVKSKQNSSNYICFKKLKIFYYFLNIIKYFKNKEDDECCDKTMIVYSTVNPEGYLKG